MQFIFFFILGLIAGSFLNCVIYRLEKDQSFLRGRSFCPGCKHTLCWYDLIPIFSFLALQGKCRYCRKKISWQYPAVELATGLIFVLIFNFFAQGGPAWGGQFSPLNFQNLINIIYLFVTACLLIIVFVYDLKHYLIPEKVLFLATGLALLYNILYFRFYILNSLYSAIGASLFFLLIFLVSRGKWMGFGDVELAFFMGFFLGFPNILVALFLAFSIGAIIGVGLIVSGRKRWGSELPFGPFLVLGTFLALFWGQQLVNLYLSFLNL